MYILIGLDDIDSYSGGCTTHFATFVVEKIISLSGIITDYPRLIRLNPDVPWRTRGNGAVAIEAYIPSRKFSFFQSWIEEYLSKYLELENGFRIGTQPGIIILDGSKLQRKDFKKLYMYSRNAMYKIISVNVLEKMMSSFKDKILYFFNLYGKRGLIGALAAVGNYLPKDHTYELLVYRNFLERSEARKINIFPDISYEDENTFAHVDLETNKPIWSPHGPDPVILGIRGNKISSILSIFSRIKKYISFDRWMIFLTNQGTDEHLLAYEDSKDELNAYSQFYGVAEINGIPIKERGGHLKVESKIDRYSVDLIAYEPSGYLRKVIETLEPNIHIKVGGSLKYSSVKKGTMILNLQKAYNETSHITIYKKINPKCPRCGSSMESIGLHKGYVCKKCKYHISTDIKPTVDQIKWIPQISLPPYRSIRHLSKPLKRYGREYNTRFKGIKSYFWYSSAKNSSDNSAKEIDLS